MKEAKREIVCVAFWGGWMGCVGVCLFVGLFCLFVWGVLLLLVVWGGFVCLSFVFVCFVL